MRRDHRRDACATFSEEIMDADVNHDAFERWWAATPESKLELIDGQSCPI
jgi:hypothetical protein